MSIYYRFKGNLYFENETEAKKYYDELTTNDESLFSYSASNLILKGHKIAFWETGNFCSASLVLTTQDLITKITGFAVRGKVEFSEGESSENYYSSYISPAVLRGWERKRQKAIEKREKQKEKESKN